MYNKGERWLLELTTGMAVTLQLKLVKDVEIEGEFPSRHLLLNYLTRNMQYILNHRCQIKRFPWCFTTFKIVKFEPPNEIITYDFNSLTSPIKQSELFKATYLC